MYYNTNLRWWLLYNVDKIFWRFMFTCGKWWLQLKWLYFFRGNSGLFLFQEEFWRRKHTTPVIWIWLFHHQIPQSGEHHRCKWEYRWRGNKSKVMIQELVWVQPKWRSICSCSKSGRFVDIYKFNIGLVNITILFVPPLIQVFLWQLY